MLNYNIYLLTIRMNSVLCTTTAVCVVLCLWYV